MDIPSITALKLAIAAIEDQAARKTLCLTALQQLFPGSLDKTDTEELQNEQFDLLSVAQHLRKQLKLRGFVEMPAKVSSTATRKAKKTEIKEVAVRIRPTKAALRTGRPLLTPRTVVFDGKQVTPRKNFSNIQWSQLAFTVIGEPNGVPVHRPDYIATVQRS